MSIILFVFQRLRSVILVFFGLWRRAFCCFRRKRRPSDSLPLTTVDVISDNTKLNENELNSWNNWDEHGDGKHKPHTVQEHIEYYRQQAIAARTIQQEEEIVPDYFEDMTPKITEQLKVVIKTKDDSVQLAQHPTNRLALAPELINTGNTLGEWHETAWENEASEDWDVDSLLREKRRQEREKQQQRRQQKNTRPHFGSTKVTT